MLNQLISDRIDHIKIEHYARDSHATLSTRGQVVAFFNGRKVGYIHTYVRTMPGWVQTSSTTWERRR